MTTPPPVFVHSPGAFACDRTDCRARADVGHDMVYRVALEANRFARSAVAGLVLVDESRIA